MNPDGSEEVTMAPRVLLNAQNEVEYRGNTISLSQLLLPLLRGFQQITGRGNS